MFASRRSKKPERFLLNKRNKGEVGKTLKSMVYVKRITLGEDALQDGKKKQKASRCEAASGVRSRKRL